MKESRQRIEPTLAMPPFIRNEVASSAVIRGSEVWDAFTGGSNGAPSESEALSISAVYACVQIIAGAIASLPMHIYRRAPDGDRDRDQAAPLWWVLNEQFSPRWAASAGWQFLIGSKLLHGDGFAEILRGPAGVVTGLVPLHPQRVRVVASPDGDRLLYEVQPDPTIAAPSPAASRMRVLDQDDVLHVPGFGFNGLRGLSPLRQALRTTGRLAVSAQEFASAFMQNMARPDYVLKTDQNLTQAAIDTLRAQLNERHRGPLEGGKPMILQGGLSVQPLTMPLEDVQLLETRKFQVEEIARIYGVPPFMIGHTEKTSSWGTGVESMGRGFARFTLRDHLNAVQNEINRKCFRTASRVAEFDTTELERADTKSMFEALRVGLGRAGEDAFMTIEEVRERLNLAREPKGELRRGVATPTVPAQEPAA